MKTGKIILISAFSALAIFSGCKKDEDKVEDAKLDEDKLLSIKQTLEIMDQVEGNSIGSYGDKELKE